MQRSSNSKQTDMGWPGYGPWTYTSLSEPLLTSELARLSGAKSIGKTDCVSFQPCLNPDQRNQDRYVVVDWELSNGTWQFRGIFDGHAGHDTVDHIVETLHPIIKTSLISAMGNSGDVGLSPTSVSEILVKAISSLDEAIAKDLLDLFPGGPDIIAKLSDGEIRAIINDSESGGKNSAKLMRCMRGSTVLVSLIDPTGSNLWVVSLGDCQAVLGTKRPSGEWEASLLSSYHNGTNETEVERVKREHPGEDECMLNDRVLGAIAVTRAVGDHLFKLPVIYTERVFMNANPGFRFSTKVEDFIARNLTPPYLTSQADVRHVDLESLEASESCLIMFSDGLIDLYGEADRNVGVLAKLCVQVVGRRGPMDPQRSRNSALSLLREGLGGLDIEKVSRMITVEMLQRWMDDTTIIVQWL